MEDSEIFPVGKRREILAAFLGRFLGDVPDEAIREAYAKYAAGNARTYLDVSATLPA